MSSAVRRFLEIVDRYRLDRMLPELAYDIREARAGRRTEDRAEFLLRHLEPFLDELDRLPLHLLEWPSDDELNGDGPPDIELGCVRDQPDTRFGLRLLDRARSVIVAGAVGAGKSTAIRGIIMGVDRLAKQRGKPISILVLDRKGGEYGDLPGLLGDNWQHYHAQHGAWLGLNAPRGFPAHVWTSIVCALFAIAAGLVAGAGVLAQAMVWLLSLLNPGGGPADRWPDFQLILETVRRAPRAFAQKPEYAQSLLAKLEEVVRASGDLLRTFRGLDVEQIVAQGKSAAIDIANVEPPFLRMLVVWVILAQILSSRNQRGHLVETLEVLVVLDEADQDVSRAVESRFAAAGTLSPTGALLQHGREWGVAGVIGLHAMGTASREVLTNSPYHLIFNLADAESIAEAARTLLLPPGAGRIFPALRPGECFFRQAQSSWATPVLCTVDPVPPNRNPAPPVYDVPPCIPALPLDQLPEVLAALRQLRSPAKNAAADLAASAPQELPDLARNLMDLWALRPFTPPVRLWPELGAPSFEAQSAAREELASRKLAEFEDARISRTKISLMDITPEGWQFLRKAPPEMRGRGGLVHRHFANWLALAGRKRGYEAIVEWPVPGTGHTADCAWQIDGAWMIWECVVNCRENLCQHLRACLLESSAVAAVVVVAAEKRILRELEALVDADADLAPVRARISFETIEPYLREVYGA